MTRMNRTVEIDALACRRVRVVVMVALWAYLTAFMPAASAQVSGVRSFDGGVGPLFKLVGPGNLYLDSSGTQGYMYNFGVFESYNFRSPGGQAWSGALGTLGPQLSIGLIQGANQVGSPVVLPAPPRQVLPAPRIQSSLLEFLDEIP